MNDFAIRAEHLAKEYRIPAVRNNYATLREALTTSAVRSLRAAGSLLRGETSRREKDVVWVALRDVSFDVRRGEIVGIIGRNGAGKSTLLKILSRITEPTRGRARFRGRVRSLLEVGTGFHPELTGRENVYMNGAILGMKRAEIRRRFDEIVAFAEVETFLDTAVKHYSSGMYLRLAFAVAAHLEPEILLVDEVLAVGDAAFQKRCLGKMSEFAGHGRTVLFVSHNLPAVRTLCHRAILLERGMIVHDGDPSSVVQKYLEDDQVRNSQIWSGDQRPGNASVRLNSVRVTTAEGRASETMPLSEPFAVEIHYEALHDGAHASFSVIMTDGDGAPLFASFSNTEPRYYGKPLQRGEYVSRCIVNGDFLNSGTFSISVYGFSAHWTDPFRVDHAVTIAVTDDGALRGDYYGPYGGALRPRLLWETRRAEHLDVNSTR